MQNELLDLTVDCALNLLVAWPIFLSSSMFDCLLKFLFERERSCSLRHRRYRFLFNLIYFD